MTQWCFRAGMINTSFERTLCCWELLPHAVTNNRHKIERDISATAEVVEIKYWIYIFRGCSKDRPLLAIQLPLQYMKTNLENFDHRLLGS